MNNDKTKKQKTKKPDMPGNDTLNGIERWVPDGSERPSQFKYESPAGIWYKSTLEHAACLGRGGKPESEWVAVAPEPDESEEPAVKS